MYANLNILTNEECEVLISQKEHLGHLMFNKEYEICAGKKHKEPQDGIVFQRKPKPMSLLKQERELKATGMFFIHCSLKLRNLT